LGNWKSENAGTVYVVKQGCHGIGNWGGWWCSVVTVMQRRENGVIWESMFGFGDQGLWVNGLWAEVKVRLLEIGTGWLWLCRLGVMAVLVYGLNGWCFGLNLRWWSRVCGFEWWCWYSLVETG
jgi:hypothetical protein